MSSNSQSGYFLLQNLEAETERQKALCCRPLRTSRKFLPGKRTAFKREDYKRLTPESLGNLRKILADTVKIIYGLQSDEDGNGVASE